MGASPDFEKPAFTNPLDADLDAIRDNYHFLLMVAASGSIVLPGWQTTVTPTNAGQAAADYSQPVTITLTRGTKKIYIHYVWTDLAVSSIQMCYDDGVSSPGLTCFDPILFWYDDEGNPTGSEEIVTLTAKKIGLHSGTVVNYYTSSQGLINVPYTAMTLVFSFYGDEYGGTGNAKAIFSAASSRFYNGYYSSLGGWTAIASATPSTGVFTYSTTPGPVTIGSWHSIMFAVNASGNGKLVVDGTLVQSYAVGAKNFHAHNFNGTCYLGKNQTTPSAQSGGISHVWCDDQYLDPETEYSKFFDSNNKPKNLGTDGSTPTGTQPLSYFPNGDPTDNRGSIANWTEVGTVADFSPSPTD